MNSTFDSVRRWEWYRWVLLVGVIFIAVSIPLFIAGIWGDPRFAGTGAVFGVMGFVGLCVGGIAMDIDNA